MVSGRGAVRGDEVWRGHPSVHVTTDPAVRVREEGKAASNASRGRRVRAKVSKEAACWSLRPHMLSLMPMLMLLMLLMPFVSVLPLLAPLLLTSMFVPATCLPCNPSVRC